MKKLFLVKIVTGVMMLAGCSTPVAEDGGNIEACKIYKINWAATGDALAGFDEPGGTVLGVDATSDMSKSIIEDAVELASGDLKKYLGYELLFWESLSQPEWPNPTFDKIPEDFQVGLILDICSSLGVDVKGEAD